MCGGIVINHIKKGLFLSLSVKTFFKSANIWQSYIQEGGCRVCGATITPLTAEEFTRHLEYDEKLSRWRETAGGCYLLSHCV